MRNASIGGRVDGLRQTSNRRSAVQGLSRSLDCQTVTIHAGVIEPLPELDWLVLPSGFDLALAHAVTVDTLMRHRRLRKSA
jgi:hypothetical protein